MSLKPPSAFALSGPSETLRLDRLFQATGVEVEAELSCWYISIGIRFAEPMVDRAVLDSLHHLLEADDEFEAWIEPNDRTALSVTTELSAVDSHAALAAGQELARQVLAAIELEAHVEEVFAQADDDKEEESPENIIWRLDRELE